MPTTIMGEEPFIGDNPMSARGAIMSKGIVLLLGSNDAAGLSETYCENSLLRASHRNHFSP